MVTKYDKIIIGAGLYGLYSAKYSEDKTERVLKRVLKLKIAQNIYFFSFFYEIRRKMEAVSQSRDFGSDSGIYILRDGI